MGLTFNGINQSQIAITGGVSIAEKDASFLAGYMANNSTTTIGTVPANKIWRIIHVSVVDNCGNGTHYASVNLNGNVFCKVSPSGTAGASIWAQDTYNGNISAGPKLTAGQLVTTTASAGVIEAFYRVVYVEEDA
jgi:hypothetical protein